MLLNHLEASSVADVGWGKKGHKKDLKKSLVCTDRSQTQRCCLPFPSLFIRRFFRRSNTYEHKETGQKNSSLAFL